LDVQHAEQEPIEAPEETIARTRELLTRSRSTLDAVTKRLATREEPDAPAPPDLDTIG